MVSHQILQNGIGSLRRKRDGSTCDDVVVNIDNPRLFQHLVQVFMEALVPSYERNGLQHFTGLGRL